MTATAQRAIPVKSTCATNDVALHHVQRPGASNGHWPVASPRWPAPQGAHRAIRIVIADDHPVVLGGIKTFLGSCAGLEVVGEARNGEEALQQACELRPDLVLMDVSMPGSSGVRATAQIVRRCPRTRVLALTVHEDPETLQTMFAVGVSGYVLKRASASNLLTAINSVCRGRKFIDPGLPEESAGELRAALNPAPGITASFSKREMQVLALLARGYTNKQVAEQLEIGVKTAETYRARLSQKAGLRGRASIVRYALANGLLLPEMAA